LKFGIIGFRKPEILIHAASLLNRSSVCIAATEDDGGIEDWRHPGNDNVKLII